ncbi:MAG: hypothetical protein M3295_02460, partial [Chloroflexota bacterium]|nr:hypothetical protein [Chloroflexota bacterium]
LPPVTSMPTPVPTPTPTPDATPTEPAVVLPPPPPPAPPLAPIEPAPAVTPEPDPEPQRDMTRDAQSSPAPDSVPVPPVAQLPSVVPEPLAMPQPGPMEPGNPVAAFVFGAVDQVSRVVQPEAAATVAATFSFPLVLMAIVGLFLVVQGRVDHRDPKLRMAPLTSIDTVVSFVPEDEL